MVPPASASDPPRARLRCPWCGDLVSVLIVTGGAREECPKCRRPIPLNEPRALAASDFQASVLEAEMPVLVAFSAEWCAPCKWLDPYLGEVVSSATGRLLAFKVDVDEAPGLVRRYGIASVPTVLLIRAGREEDRSLGVEPERLREMAAGAG